MMQPMPVIMPKQAKKASIIPADRAVITSYELPILRAILFNHYMTAEQVTRLLYSPGSLTTVQAHLKRLRDAKGLLQVRLHRRTHPQPWTHVHTLTQRGLRALETLGVDLPERFSPLYHKDMDPRFLDHTLAVTDIVIAATRFAQTGAGVELRGALHEHHLREKSVRVEVTEGAERRLVTVPVIPDLWLDLAVRRDNAERLAPTGAPYRECYVWEIDRDTEESKRWKRKVRALCAWARAPYQTGFGDAPLSAIAVLATTGERRGRALLAWTEAVIRELPAPEQALPARLFRVSWGEPGRCAPAELFTAHRWYRPFESAPVGLL